jgi:hypothetical protein
MQMVTYDDPSMRKTFIFPKYIRRAYVLTFFFLNEITFLHVFESLVSRMETSDIRDQICYLNKWQHRRVIKGQKEKHVEQLKSATTT